MGEAYGEETDAQFVIVEVTIENRAQESFTISSALFQIEDGQERRYDMDTDAAVYLDDSVIYE